MQAITSFSKIPKILAIIALVLTIMVIALGSYTRLKDAGLGCPDWPGCYGQLTAPATTAAKEQALLAYPEQVIEVGKAKIEMLHRYLAGSLGTLILLMAVTVFFTKNLSTLPKFIAFALVGLVIMQALLGMWTVTLKLYPPAVMGHLLGGLSMLAFIWWFYLAQNPKKLSIAMPLKPKSGLILSVLGLLFLVLQIALGGWTSSNYAALICPDFPYCQGNLLPTLDLKSAILTPWELGPNYQGGVLDNTARITVHMLHRLWAIATAIILGVLAVLALTKYRYLGVGKAAILLFSLLILQVLLGITNVIKFLPLHVAVSHTVVAALMLLTVITLTFVFARACNNRYDNYA